MNCPPPFDDAAKTVNFDLPEGITKMETKSGKVSLKVQVSRIHVGIFDVTEAGLEEAKLRHQS